MAKIYDRNQRSEPGKEYKPPTEPVQVQKRAMAILVALILGLVVVLLLYRMARGEDQYLSRAIANVPVLASFHLVDR